MVTDNDLFVDRLYNQKELNNFYKHLYYIIENFDEQAINELCSGSEKDIDRVLLVLAEEANRILNIRLDDINTTSLEQLPNVTRSLDEYLKRYSYNYFKLTTLPNYDMWYHNIEWGNFVQLYQKLVILASRGLGKTFEFDNSYPLWTMYRYRKDTPIIRQPFEIKACKEGVSITNTFGLAKRVLADIKAEIEANDILRNYLYPEKRGEGKWEDTSIECKNGAKWIIRSSDSQIRGIHLFKIVVDDFLDKSVLYSSEQNNKLKEVFFGEIMGILEPGGNIIVVGTPFTKTDLYSDLAASKDWKLFEYPAIWQDGTITNPLRFNMKYYESQKELLGSMIFAREYLCRPISDQASIFPYDILKNAFIGMDNITYVNRIQEYKKKFKRIVCGCDYAISGNIGADFSVFSVVGLDEQDVYHLIHVWRKRGASHHEQISQMQRIKYDFNPDTFICENNGFQRIMSDLAREAGITNVQEFTTTGLNKKDLYNGLPSLAALYEQGRIKMPRGNEESRALTDLICAEFNSITFNEDKSKLESSGGHDDTCLSIFFAIKGEGILNNQININFI